MTSSAQLKYLDAIGIPVWVSRDRVIQLTALQSHETGATSSADSDLIGSVDKILHNLDNVQIEKLATDEATPKTNTTTATTNLTPSSTHINEIGRTEQHTLYALGNLNADWLIIGESPETAEALQSQPFSADAGLLLSNMLKSIGLHNPREDAYLINVLKQASSFNDLKQSDLEQSTLQLNKLLHKKIVAINPKIILIVGQVSAQNLLQSAEPLVRLRSKQHTLPNTDFPVVVTYYPSYLLSKPTDKRKAWDDLKLALSRFNTH